MFACTVAGGGVRGSGDLPFRGWMAGELGVKKDLPEGVILGVCDWDMWPTKSK
jgi:hypothetical protein